MTRSIEFTISTPKQQGWKEGESGERLTFQSCLRFCNGQFPFSAIDASLEIRLDDWVDGVDLLLQFGGEWNFGIIKERFRVTGWSIDTACDHRRQ